MQNRPPSETLLPELDKKLFFGDACQTPPPITFQSLVQKVCFRDPCIDPGDQPLLKNGLVHVSHRPLAAPLPWPMKFNRPCVGGVATAIRAGNQSHAASGDCLDLGVSGWEVLGSTPPQLSANVLCTLPDYPGRFAQKMGKQGPKLVARFLTIVQGFASQGVSLEGKRNSGPQDWPFYMKGFTQLVGCPWPQQPKSAFLGGVGSG